MSASPHTGAGAGAKPLRVDDVLYEAALSERLPNLQAENAAMLELVRALATAPGSVVQRLVETACALTGAGSAGLSVIDRENGEDVFRWVATTGEYARYVSGTMPRDFSPCGEVLHRGTPLLMRDLRRIYPYVDAMHAPPANALLVPFAEDGRLVGTIWVLHHDAEADFDSEDLRIVSSLSVFASAVNATVGLVRQLQEQQARQAHDLEFHERELRDTRRLHTVAAQLIGADGGSAIYNDILNAAIEIVDADAGTIQLLDPRTQTLSLLATRGFGAEMRAHFEQVDAMSGSPCGRALAAGRREFVVFDPELADPDGATRRHLEAGLVCAQSTPLVSRSGRAVGMCSTHWRTRRVLTDRELRFLDLLGRQAADLIERSQVHAALQASEQSLRDQARRKDEFIAMLAHELRNPLAPIRTGIALLKHAQEPLVTQVRPMMERQVEHMVRLVDDLLDVSRITSGRVQLKREMVTVGSLVDSAVESQQPALEAGGIVLCRALDDPGQQVHVDPARLSQVVANILHNAVKFTPAGGRITVRTAVERGERARAAWASGWRCPAPWSSCMAAASPPRAPARARAAASQCGFRCRPLLPRPVRSRRRRPKRRPRGRRASRCWSSTTTATPRTPWRCCSSSAAARCVSPTAPWLGWSCCSASSRRSCCWISACPRSMAMRPAGASAWRMATASSSPR
jgi:signal transduction histidine kinase